MKTHFANASDRLTPDEREAYHRAVFINMDTAAGAESLRDAPWIGGRKEDRE